MRKLIIAAAVVCLPALASAASGNLLTNGSFENGFSGWTLSGTEQSNPPSTINYNSATAYPTGAYGEAVPMDNASAPSFDAVGTHAAYFVDDFANETLSQSVTLVAGTSYQFGFDAYLPANGFANRGDAAFTARLGTNVFSAFAVSTGQPTSWTHFAGTLTPVTGGSTSLAFTFNTNLSPSKDVVIDRVYLATTSDVTAAVPEPETYALMLAGLGAVGFIARRRKD